MTPKFIRKEMPMGKDMTYANYLIETDTYMKNGETTTYLISNIIMIIGKGSYTEFIMVGGLDFTKCDCIGDEGKVLPGNHFRSYHSGTIINFHRAPFPFVLLKGLVTMEEDNFARVSTRGKKAYLMAIPRFTPLIGFKWIRKNKKKE